MISRPIAHRAIRASLLLATVAAGPSAAAAVGEAVDGFPNWRERVIHQWINRARADPPFEMAACGGNCGEKACYAPLPPLPWSHALNSAARFHSDEMRLQGYFAHDSRCTVPSDISSLYPHACDGTAACACSGSASTPWWQRVQYFGASPAGEIIASPTDPDYAFYLWLYEPSATTACQFTSANGHRWLILKAQGSVGVGVSGPAVGDFGHGGTPARVPSGSHYPQQADTVALWANWYDAAGPTSAAVNVEGSCHPLQLGRGTTTNGAWHAEVAGVGGGCHRYFFVFRDGSGRQVTYPTSGSLAIGSGAGCPDWSAVRPAACAGVPSATPTSASTATPTHTAPATPSPTPTAYVGGHIRRADSNEGVAEVVLHAIAAASTHTATTNADGSYALALTAGDVRVVPMSDMEAADAVTEADASALLSSIVAGGSVDAHTHIVGDVTGNGVLTAFDAALILRRASGWSEEFPAIVGCGWRTVYVPVGGVAGMSANLPDPATCRQGEYVVPSGASSTDGVDFEAMHLGDVD